MENIEQQILRFNELSMEEQQAIEAYVEMHPEWRSFWEEVKALHALREEMQLFQDVDDEALAYYVVAQHFDVVGDSAALQRVFDRVEERLSNDPGLHARYSELVQRLENLTATLDPIAQFEELSGFCLSPEEGVEAASGAPGREAVPGARSSSRRSAPIFTLSRAVRWAAAAVVLVAAVYGALFTVSYFTQSRIEQLALVDLSETEIGGYQLVTRGGQASIDSLSTDALYLHALQTLRAARITTLGLFPRYDRQRLTEAEDLLQRVIEREPSRSFLQIEAYFFLGKVHLAQGEIEAARSNFQTVIHHEGRRTQEAVEILTVLQEQYPAHGQSYVRGQSYMIG